MDDLNLLLCLATDRSEFGEHAAKTENTFEDCLEDHQLIFVLIFNQRQNGITVKSHRNYIGKIILPGWLSTQYYLKESICITKECLGNLLEKMLQNTKLCHLLLLQSFNVYMEGAQSSAYLLEWLNLERSHFGRHRYLSSYLQVLQEGFLYDILVDVDSLSFEGFGEADQNKKLDTLDKYVQREFGKRIKWSFKQSVGDFSQESHIREFAKLVCFFTIYSKKKNDYVSRILTLSEQSQRSLMEEMQKMELKMENITEIKEIIEQIEYLEQENQELKAKLEEMARVNSEMLQLLKETEDENRGFKSEIEAYRKEKSQVFAALEIYSISEYLQAYNKLKREGERCLEALQETQGKLEHSEVNIKDLNDRIKCDSMVISNLSDEITRLKQLCSDSHRNLEWLGSHSNSKLNLLKSAGSNKENFSKCSTSLGKQSLEVPAEWVSFAQIDEENNQKSFMRAHNEELSSKLQCMYSKYNQLNNESTQLKEQNRKLTKSHTNLRKVLKQVESTYKQFEFKYKAAANEDRHMFGIMAYNKTAL